MADYTIISFDDDGSKILAQPGAGQTTETRKTGLNEWRWKTMAKVNHLH